MNYLNGKKPLVRRTKDLVAPKLGLSEEDFAEFDYSGGRGCSEALRSPTAPGTTSRSIGGESENKHAGRGYDDDEEEGVLALALAGGDGGVLARSRRESRGWGRGDGGLCGDHVDVGRGPVHPFRHVISAGRSRDGCGRDYCEPP